jgi:2,4-dienoyl-CoA reductase-like NADH-dependent reductase (Old Yellow Enzyme family)
VLDYYEERSKGGVGLIIVEVGIQIGHAGNVGQIAITGQQPVAPSVVKRYGSYDLPRALEIGEIP